MLQVHYAAADAVNGGGPFRGPAVKVHDEMAPMSLVVLENSGQGMKYGVVDQEGHVYAEADSMAALIPWMAEYALEMDKLGG